MAAHDAIVLDTLALDASVLDTQASIAQAQKPDESHEKEISAIASEETSGASTLDPEILKVLDADPSKPKHSEFKLQDELTTRWKFWLSTLLETEEMNWFMDQYPRGSDKCLLEAPKLNPEIAAMSTEALIQRD